jgi:hypothetical protein
LVRSSASVIARRSVLIRSSGRASSGAIAASIAEPLMSGSSPWTFTIRSHVNAAATSASRSVPLG